MTRTPYVSIDIETTGLDDSYCQVIEVGAVIDDWVTPVDQLPRFHGYVTHDKIIGEPFALAMNAEILKRIANKGKEPHYPFYQPWEVMGSLSDFLHCHHAAGATIVPAGKNYTGFDKNFLKHLPGYDQIKFHHRAIDPGMMFFDPSIDKEPPSTKTCMERAGIAGEVAHTAVEDAIGVIKMIRFAAERTALIKRLTFGFDPANPRPVMVVLGAEPGPEHLNFDAFARQFFGSKLGEPHRTRHATPTNPGAKELASIIAQQFQDNGQFEGQRK